MQKWKKSKHVNSALAPLWIMGQFVCFKGMPTSFWMWCLKTHWCLTSPRDNNLICLFCLDTCFMWQLRTRYSWRQLHAWLNVIPVAVTRSFSISIDRKVYIFTGTADILALNRPLDFSGANVDLSFLVYKLSVDQQRPQAKALYEWKVSSICQISLIYQIVKL